MLGELFIAFVKIGLFSFGGGYAVIPSIQYQANSLGWMSDSAFGKSILISGMAPGPIATNSATLIGYQIAGINGAIVSTIGMILPSFILIIIVALFFYKIRGKQWVKATLYGLKPIITVLIFYAAFHLFVLGKEGSMLNWTIGATLVIVGLAVYGLLKYKLHPLWVIAGSGLAGIILF
ncbi:chromate transporter [Cohnella sp. NL03-T5]|uniref:Chromate transporter n=1 Tax=Cohnella silvisoli TaxID=2873699 RepID=A0ABV1KQW3_9BACL|nr:chromate transporter [Cohnella silvisoli]